jgi:hypothetical protein
MVGLRSSGLVHSGLVGLKIVAVGQYIWADDDEQDILK